jgi:hypothetical protein
MDPVMTTLIVIYLVFATYVAVEVFRLPTLKVRSRAYRVVLSILFGLVWPITLALPHVIGFISMFLDRKKEGK